MSYLPENLSLPDTKEIDTKEWWDACSRRELIIQRCSGCGTLRHPPAPVCYQCHSFDFGWHKVGGKGKVFTYTICYHPAHSSLQGHAPYNVVVVELADAGNVRMVGNLLDVPNDQVRIGMDVEVTWEERGGVMMPQWKRAGK